MVNNRQSQRLPRTARRSRKPLQDSKLKGHPRGIWVRCGYSNCSYEWQYFGGRRWAECPVCHSTTKVASARRNYEQ